MQLIQKYFSKLGQGIEKVLIWEQNCVFCGCNSSQQICKDCFLSLPKMQHQPHCPKCLIYLPPKEIRCPNCAEHNFHFNRIITAYEYAFPLDRLLHQLKYHGKIEYTRVISQLFWQQIAPQLHQRLPDVIIPVPLHSNKQKQRGFNQVHELLMEFRQLNPQAKIYHARRNKETISQATLSRQQRVQNMQGAFQIKLNLTNQRVAIVDDVVTTGTTVSELANLCKQAGAIQVDVWCLMRANHD